MSGGNGAIRALDHFVLLTENLERTAETYRNLGFDVRPIAHHIELNSSNCVIHFANTYLELIYLTEAPEDLKGPYMDRLKCGEGLVHVSLTSDDLEVDYPRMEALGLTTRPITSARRKVIMPDGSEDETASRCFYMWRDSNRYLSLFLSDHPKPETIFIPEYERHANTAIDVCRLVYMSVDPESVIDYYTTLFGKAPDVVGVDGFAVTGARGEVTQVLNPDAARARYGKFLPCSHPEPLSGIPAAMHFSTADLDTCRQALARSGAEFRDWDKGLIVPAAAANGCTLVFEAPGA